MTDYPRLDDVKIAPAADPLESLFYHVTFLGKKL